MTIATLTHIPEIGVTINNAGPSTAESYYANIPDKFNAEIGYHNIASVKTGTGTAKEIVGLLNIARKNINQFEQQLGQMSLQINSSYLTN